MRRALAWGSVSNGLQETGICVIMPQEVTQLKYKTGEVYSLPDLVLLSRALAYGAPPSSVPAGECMQHRLLVPLGFTPRLPGTLSPLPNSMC